MKDYSLLIITCCIYRYSTIEIKSELKKNIWRFGYGLNNKYKGMLAHSFNRFYAVKKIILPSIKDLKFSNLNHEYRCLYLQEKINTLQKLKNIF